MNKLIDIEGINYDGDNTDHLAHLTSQYVFECSNRYMLKTAVSTILISFIFVQNIFEKK